MSGKMQGQLYKVCISPSGVKYYSLAKAIKDGNFNGDGCKDGRKKARKTNTKKQELAGMTTIGTRVN